MSLVSNGYKQTSGEKKILFTSKDLVNIWNRIGLPTFNWHDVRQKENMH